MPRLAAPQRDLSQMDGNPTSAIQKHYRELMTIQDPQELRDAVLQIVQPLVGKGMSEGNFRKFMMALDQSMQRGLQKVQSYLSNYMLKGSGLGVAENTIQAIGSLLTEDAHVFRELSPNQKKLKTLVESYGFTVILVD